MKANGRFRNPNVVEKANTNQQILTNPEISSMALNSALSIKWKFFEKSTAYFNNETVSS